MFCKIRKGKNYFTIYACSRERVNGKVVSTDTKICTVNWLSLYEDNEEVDGLKKSIPDNLYRFLRTNYFSSRRTELSFDYDVVPKIIQVKKDFYPTYKKQIVIKKNEWKKEEKEKREKEKKEYEDFKKKFILLYSADMSKSYKEGYKQGAQDHSYRSNRSSGVTISYDTKETQLLKEAFKLLAMKHHPDRGGDNETMAAINNLKEKILK